MPVPAQGLDQLLPSFLKLVTFNRTDISSKQDQHSGFIRLKREKSFGNKDSVFLSSVFPFFSFILSDENAAFRDNAL